MSIGDGSCWAKPVQMNEIAANRSDIPEHAEAAASILTRHARLIRSGVSVQDTMLELLPIVTALARRT